MIKTNYKYCLLAIALILAPALFSCSQKLERRGDAIRIKADSAKNYRWNKYTQSFRSGSTLRGTAVAAKIILSPTPCPNPEDTLIYKYLVFIDALSKECQYEYIPFDAIDFIADSLGMAQDTALIFENFNNPAGIRELRKVRIDSIIGDCNPCNCRELDMPGFELELPTIKISCVKRNFSRAFIELKGGYHVFTDITSGGFEEGREGWAGEVASGLRFGDEDNSGTDNWNPPWAAGMTFSTGVNIFNSFNDDIITRPAVLLYGRWQSPEDRFIGLCMRPFVYGQFGLTIDELTLDLLRINWCGDCEECGEGIDFPTLEAQPNIDWSLPVSWGIGAGFDIPLFPFMDLSVDMGFRSLAFGEITNALDLIAPTGRRIDMFLFRFGLTF